MDTLKASDLKPGMFVEITETAYKNAFSVEIEVVTEHAAGLPLLTGVNVEGRPFTWYTTPTTKFRLAKPPKDFETIKKTRWPEKVWGLRGGNNGADPELFVLGEDKTVLEAWK